MKIVLESIDAAGGPPVASLRVLYKERFLGRIELPVEEPDEGASGIAERLRDFSDCLVEWTRQGKDLASPGEDSSRPARR